MGIVLPLLAAPIQTLQPLLHGLLKPLRQPQPPAQQPLGQPGALHRPSGTPDRQRPPRGNWPFTVRPPSPAAPARAAAQPPKVLRQPATGRLVIAGRMADVCAELDRLAALEALQA